MKRILLTTALIFTVLITGVFGTLLVAVRLNAVHQFALSRVNALIPGTITLQRLHLSPFRTRLEIKAVSLDDSAGKPLAGFDRLLVDISTPDLFKRTLVIRNAVLEHPWAVLEIDSSGRLTFLDAFPSGQSVPKDTTRTDSALNPPPIIIRNLEIIGGKVVYAARHQDIKARIYGLSLAANGETNTMTANASVTLDSITVQTARNAVRIQDLSLIFGIRNMDIDTVALKLRTGHSSFTLNGSASSLTHDPRLAIRIATDVALSEISSIAGLGEALDGRAELAAHVNGIVSNPDLELEIAYKGGTVGGYPVDSLLLRTRLSDRVLAVRELTVGAMGAGIGMSGEIDARGAFPEGFLHPPGSMQELGYALNLSGQNISLDRVVPNLSGIARLSAAVSGRGVHPDSLNAKVGLSAGTSSFRPDTSLLPVDISLSCSASVEQGVARLHGLSASIGESNLSVAGRYHLKSGDLDAAVNITVPTIDALPGISGLDSLSGSVSASARIVGNQKQPQVSITLNADTIAYGGVRIGNIGLDARLYSDGIATIRELVVTNGDSRLLLTGHARMLENGTALPPDRMSFDLSLLCDSLRIPDFLDSIRGTVGLDAKIQGTIEDPRGHIRLTAFGLHAGGQSVSRVDLDALIEQNRAIIQPLQISVEPGQDLIITGWASLKDSFEMALSTRDFQLTSIAALSAVDSLQGAISLDLRADGTYTLPQVQGNLRVAGIRKGAIPVDDIVLKMRLLDRQAEVSGTAVGSIHARCDLQTGIFSAELICADQSLTPYLALSGQDLRGTLDALVKVSGNINTPAAITGAVNVKRLILDHGEVRILETAGLEVALDSNRYSIPEFRMVLAGEGSLVGRAQGLLEGPHDITLSGTIPLSVARHFTMELPDIRGSISVDASLKGMPEAPDLKAEVEITGAGMTVPGLSQQLHSLNGRIRADPTAVRIESLRGSLDNGTFEVTGEVALAPSLEPSNLRAEISTKNLPVSIPDMLDVVLDATVRIRGTPDTTLVTGDITLVDGLYHQDVVISPLAGLGQRRRRETSPSSEELSTPFLRNMRLDVGIQARSPLRVDNNLARLTIFPDLLLMGTLQSPTLNGRARVQQGTITYRRRVFTVERGVIDFINPYAIEPRIDISGSVPVQGSLIKMEVTGTPDDLVFKLTSDVPSLGDEDLLSLLVLGRRASELQEGFQIGAGQSSQQMLASLVASTFGEDIRKATGLDMLEVETGDETTQDSDRISVTMGKQLTKRLGIKYTVESNETEVFQRATAEYRILQNFRIIGFQEDRNVFGGEVRLIWEAR